MSTWIWIALAIYLCIGIGWNWLTYEREMGGWLWNILLWPLEIAASFMGGSST